MTWLEIFPSLWNIFSFKYLHHLLEYVYHFTATPNVPNTIIQELPTNTPKMEHHET